MSDDDYVVQVWARGHYAGSYRFPTKEAAEHDARERRQKLGVLGLGYVVARADEGIEIPVGGGAPTAGGSVTVSFVEDAAPPPA